MVKRIKKRIPKADAPEGAVDTDDEDEDAAEGAEGDGAAEAGLDAGPEGPAPDLGGLASANDDAFTQKTAGIFKWVIDNGKLLAAVGAVAVIGVGAYVWMQRGDFKADAQATAAFIGANEAATKASPLLTNETSPLVGDAQRSQLEKARTLFAATKDTYKDRKVAGLATLGLAGTELELGKPAEALALYDAYLNTKPADAFAQAVALQGKAVALENQGKHADAVKVFEALKALDGKAFGLFAELEIGRLEEASGNVQGAKARYEALTKARAAELEDLANRGIKAEIEKRLARLGAAG